MFKFTNVLDSALSHGEAIVERLSTAARTRSEDYLYGWRTARDLIQLAGSGATLWLLHKKARAAIPVSVATAAIVAGLSVLSARFDRLPEHAKQPDLRDKIVNTTADILPNALGAAVLFTKSAREELSNTLDLTPRNPALPFTPGERARNLVALYATYSMVGHWAEMLFCQLIRLGVVGGDYDRSNTMLWDWWLHPFPAEGIAGIMIAGALTPLRDALLKRFGGRVAPALALSFLANQVVCTAIDYLTGMVANRNYELWDYRNMPFNFQGQVCLQNSLVYTTAATLVAWLAYPTRDAWLRRLPADAANLGFSALAPAYAFVSLLY
ncbi:MAG: putative ABC transporter permease, partial [Coriobacteriales bacterium]|nr:putative ABC transporter permease [Coriobacteriales bacterium]